MRPFFCIFICLTLPLTLFAQERSSLNIAPQLGTDIGGAIPVPFGSDERKINALPRLAPSIGLALKYTYRSRWNLGTELTYKRIVMDADARVGNQKFKGKESLQYFSGTAEMHMAFTLLEAPLYAKYNFGNHRQHSLILGGYFAYNLSASFESVAKKGFNGPEPDVVESLITDPMVMDFSSVLDTWDAGVLLGYETRIYNRVHFGLRFLAGLKEIFIPHSDFFDYKMYQMRGAVVLHYDLFRVGKGLPVP